MNTMIRLYAGGKEVQQKQAMAFDLSACVGLGKSYPELPELSSLPTVGLWGLGLGGLLVLLFTSERPFSLALTNVFGRLLDGLKGVLDSPRPLAMS